MEASQLLKEAGSDCLASIPAIDKWSGEQARVETACSLHGGKGGRRKLGPQCTIKNLDSAHQTEKNGYWNKLETGISISEREPVPCSLHLGADGGCGITGWDHPVKGIGSLQQDLVACEERAKRVAQEGDPHTGNVLTVQDHIDECLEARGYVKRSRG